jgi:hypothetical protein
MKTRGRYMMPLGWIAMSSNRRVPVDQVLEDLASTLLENPSGEISLEKAVQVDNKDQVISMICSRNSNNSSL